MMRHDLNSEAHGEEPDRSFTVDVTSGGLFFIVILLLGVITRSTSKYHRLPYTVVLMILGIILGALDEFGDAGALGDSATQWSGLSPETILFVFLPALIFGSAASVDYHVFSREMSQMLLLAFPGVVISSILTAVFSKYAFDYEFDWSTSLAFGAMLSATDPVAVVALLRELGASVRLSLLIEGESLFNDGSAIVVFLAFRSAMQGEEQTVGDIAGLFFRLSLGAAALGGIAGIALVYLLKRMHFDVVAQITTTLLAAYGVFYLAESTPLHVSGVLAVVVLGLAMASSGRTTVREHESMHAFWEMVEYIANTLVFALAGFVIFERGLINDDIRGLDVLYLLLLYVALHVVRTITNFTLRPLMKRMAYGITVKETIVLSYGGLRGAVGLVLALMIDEDTRIDQLIGARFLFHMAGIAALTLLVNGTTAGWLIRKLGLASESKASRMVFKAALEHIELRNKDVSAKLKHHEFYFDADWAKVEKFMPAVVGELEHQMTQQKPTKKGDSYWLVVFGTLCGPCLSYCERICCCNTRRSHGINRSTSLWDMDPSPRKQLSKLIEMKSGVSSAAIGSSLHTLDTSLAGRGSGQLAYTNFAADQRKLAYMKEARYRFYNLLKSHYWEMFEAGMVGRPAVEQLHKAASQAQDRSEEVLHDWVYLLGFYEKSRVRTFLQKYLPCGGEKLLFHSMSFEFDLAAAYISAHRGIERLLKEVIRDKKAIKQLQQENILLVATAQRKVDDMQETFAEITRAIKTKHVLHALIRETELAAKDLLKHGEIEEKEFDGINRSIISAWNSANLPTHIIADERTMLREVGYLSRLDDATFQSLYEASKRVVYKNGDVIYSEGDVCHGFCLILRGTVCLRRLQSGETHKHVPKKTKNFINPRRRYNSTSRLELHKAAVAGNARLHSVQDPRMHSTVDGSKSVPHTKNAHTRRLSKLAQDNSSHHMQQKNEELYSTASSVVGRYQYDTRATSDQLSDEDESKDEQLGDQNDDDSDDQYDIDDKNEKIKATRGQSGIRVRSKLSSTLNFLQDLTSSNRKFRELDEILSSDGCSSATKQLEAETTLVDRVSTGAVVGLLSMLTGQPTLVTAVCDSPVVAVHISAKDIYPLLKSSPHPSGGPIRMTKPLEEILCRMSGALVAETVLSEFKDFKPAQIRQMLSEAHLVRPEPKRPLKIQGKAILLTGALLRPRDRRQTLEMVKRIRDKSSQTTSANKDGDKHSIRAKHHRSSTLGRVAHALQHQFSFSSWKSDRNLVQKETPYSTDNVESNQINAQRTASFTKRDARDMKNKIQSRQSIKVNRSSTAPHAIMDDQNDVCSDSSRVAPRMYANSTHMSHKTSCESNQMPSLVRTKSRRSHVTTFFVSACRKLWNVIMLPFRCNQCSRQSRTDSRRPINATYEANPTALSHIDELDKPYADVNYDPEYHRHLREQHQVTIQVPDSAFLVTKRAFAFMDSEPHRERWFSDGTRILVIPYHYATMFDNAHARVMESILLHRHLRRCIDTPSPVPDAFPNGQPANDIEAVLQDDTHSVTSSVGFKRPMFPEPGTHDTSLCVGVRGTPKWLANARQSTPTENDASFMGLEQRHSHISSNIAIPVAQRMNKNFIDTNPNLSPVVASHGTVVSSTGDHQDALSVKSLSNVACRQPRKNFDQSGPNQPSQLKINQSKDARVESSSNTPVVRMRQRSWSANDIGDTTSEVSGDDSRFSARPITTPTSQPNEPLIQDHMAKYDQDSSLYLGSQGTTVNIKTPALLNSSLDVTPRSVELNARASNSTMRRPLYDMQTGEYKATKAVPHPNVELALETDPARVSMAQQARVGLISRQQTLRQRSKARSYFRTSKAQDVAYLSELSGAWSHRFCIQLESVRRPRRKRSFSYTAGTRPGIVDEETTAFCSDTDCISDRAAVRQARLKQTAQTNPTKGNTTLIQGRFQQQQQQGDAHNVVRPLHLSRQHLSVPSHHENPDSLDNVHDRKLASKHRHTKHSNDLRALAFANAYHTHHSTLSDAHPQFSHNTHKTEDATHSNERHLRVHSTEQSRSPVRSQSSSSLSNLDTQNDNLKKPQSLHRIRRSSKKRTHFVPPVAHITWKTSDGQSVGIPLGQHSQIDALFRHTHPSQNQRANDIPRDVQAGAASAAIANDGLPDTISVASGGSAEYIHAEYDDSALSFSSFAENIAGSHGSKGSHRGESFHNERL